jgi:DNA-binding GntR family transcriptional regulator
MLRSTNERIRILRIHDFTLDARIGATIAEHLEIIGLVLGGDADAAAAFMRAHVQRSALVVRERVGETLARMFSATPEAASRP